MHDTMSSGELELNAPNLDPKGLAKGGKAMGKLSNFWLIKGEFLRSKVETFSTLEWIVFYDHLHNFLDNHTEMGLTNFWLRLKPATQLKVCELFVIKDQDPMRFQIISTKEKAELFILISGVAIMTNDANNEVVQKKTGSVFGALDMFNDPKHVKEDEEDDITAPRQTIYTVKIERGCCLRLSFSDYIKYIVCPHEAVEVDLHEEPSVLDAHHTNAMAAEVLSEEICEFLESCSLLPTDEEEEDGTTEAEEEEEHLEPLEDEEEDEEEEESSSPHEVKKKRGTFRRPQKKNMSDSMRNVVQAGRHSVVTFRKYDIRMVYIFLKGEAQVSVHKRGAASTIAYKRKGERSQKIETKSMPLLNVGKGSVVSFCEDCFQVGQPGKSDEGTMSSTLKKKIQRIQDARSGLSSRKNLKLVGNSDVYSEYDYELVINFLGPTVYLSIPFHVYATAMKEYCLAAASHAHCAQGIEFQINSFATSVVEKLSHLSNWLHGELTIESGGAGNSPLSSSANTLYHTKAASIPPAVVLKHAPATRKNRLTESERQMGSVMKNSDNALMGTFQFGERSFSAKKHPGPGSNHNHTPSPNPSKGGTFIQDSVLGGSVAGGINAESVDTDAHRLLVAVPTEPSASMTALHLGSHDEDASHT